MKLIKDVVINTDGSDFIVIPKGTEVIIEHNNTDNTYFCTILDDKFNLEYVIIGSDELGLDK